MDHEQLVERYFAAMRLGADGEDEMMALFTEDVLYSDPFGAGGEVEGVIGLAALRDRLRAGWEFSPPDLELTVFTVAIDGDSATSTWECRSEVFDHPMSGRDEYTFRDGKIAELHVRMAGNPAPDSP